MGLGKQLLSFVDFLRQGGLKISHSQIADLLQVLTSGVDLANRKEVKTALCCLLAKSPEEIKIFNTLFELYFQPEEKRDEELAKLSKEKEEEEVIAAEQSLFTQAWALPSHSLFVTGRQLLPSSILKIYVKLPPALKKEIKLQLNRTVVQGGDLGAVSAEIIQFLEKWAEENLTARKDDLFCVVGGLAAANDNIKQQDLGKIKGEEMERIQFFIEKLGKKLAVLLANRLKITSKQKKLDLRKTIRKNLHCGGTIFKLVYQTKKINKPNIVLFCDVSGSMANYSLFTLQLLYGMQQVIASMESFIFGTDLERITHYFEQKNKSFVEISRQIKENSLQWRGGTTLGSSLRTFFARFSQTVNGKTTVIIISDGATRDEEAALAYLERLKQQVKSILWLNPKPENQWALSPSKVFQEHFPMFECRNIIQLEKAITNEFFR